MITIVDYKMGNLGSVVNMFKKIGMPCKVSGDANEIAQAEKILLPGDGAYNTAMRKLAELGLVEILNQKVLLDKTPLLGICIGHQLIMEGSDEGALPGFGWISGRAHLFKANEQLKVPHMGWNSVEVVSDNPITQNLGIDPRFYFVHSYYVQCSDSKHSLLKTTYGHSFDSGVYRDNIWGVQFHPEKSHKFGMRLLKNFADL